ncbi:glutamine synthetase family protein [Lentibacter algarum]|uniref:glutamine synthetase family protein n=1 Tax=Lentibacter algarum TaxID=576131 RepID=UPI001C076EF0|nr:glutamine synthetase family protein [Lentibacter algarum]MBU2980218.1 glutamine synthetase family protein [Lentibacter algarum]
MTLDNWLSDHPEIDTFLLCAPDVNGIMRGKALPVSDVKKIEAGGVRMALSSATVDVWGNEIMGCSQVAETGDCDVVMRPTGRTPIPSVLNPSHALLLVDYWMDDGTPMQTSCRHALIAFLERFAEKGLRPVVALEFEFYLLDGNAEGLAHPCSPITDRCLIGREAGQIDDLEHFATVLADIKRNCAAADINVTGLNSENSTAMFEVNLDHTDDVLRAVDDGIFLRRIIRDTAVSHGLGATFMAKPFPELDGSGLHMHFSLLDDADRNVFDNGGPVGTSLLGHAAAGLLHHMDDVQMIMAPHYSSFRRVQPNAYAPTNICWGYDNRSVPVRIPGGDTRARRIEHRLASADANPYLVALAILACTLDGIKQKMTPPEPVIGACYDQGHPNVVPNMHDALRHFSESAWVKTILPPLFLEAYINCKAQELAAFENQITPLEIQTYRDRV